MTESAGTQNKPWNEVGQAAARLAANRQKAINSKPAQIQEKSWQAGEQPMPKLDLATVRQDMARGRFDATEMKRMSRAPRAAR